MAQRPVSEGANHSVSVGSKKRLRLLRTEQVLRVGTAIGRYKMAFWTLNTMRVCPIHHRKTSRVISHVFLCMLAYYVDYHLRKQLAAIVFAEDDPDGNRRSVRVPWPRPWTE